MDHKKLSFVLLAILFFVLGVQAASSGWIAIPEQIPEDLSVAGFLPLLTRHYSSTASAGGTLMVFSTGAVTTGLAGGRSGMNLICMDQDPSSHFCSLNEIESAMMYGGVRFSLDFAEAWVDNVYLGSVITHQVDGVSHNSRWTRDNCEGWTENNIAVEATYILDDATGLNIEPDGAGQYLIGLCSIERHVACCRWEP